MLHWYILQAICYTLHTSHWVHCTLHIAHCMLCTAEHTTAVQSTVIFKQEGHLQDVCCVWWYSVRVSECHIWSSHHTFWHLQSSHMFRTFRTGKPNWGTGRFASSGLDMRWYNILGLGEGLYSMTSCFYSWLGNSVLHTFTCKLEYKDWWIIYAI